MVDTLTMLLFVCIVAALVAGVSYVVWHNGRVLGLSPARCRWYAGGTALLLVAWLSVMGRLAGSGFFGAFLTQFPPPFALALLPPWLLIICCVGVPALRAYLVVTPLVWLTGYQSFRIGIEYILWLLYHQGALPHAITFEGQNIDLLVGITAPVVAVLVARQRAGTHLLALVWNTAALLILLNTVRVAFQSVPGPFHDPTMQPPNMIVGQVPFIWLPSFVVPMALLGHAVALAKVIPAVLHKHKQPAAKTAA